MKQLSLSDRRHVEAAKGWCELHAFEHASEDLQRAMPDNRARPGAPEALQVHGNLGKSEETLDLANAIRTTLPDEEKNCLFKAWII